ncbi:FidL-like protein [Pantoea sp. C2G6]|uniref:FidL-like protein n=1 Tax=Pantoea sp. C2G6 TaxID=3243084 RepID=UPI003EDB372D
MLSLTLAALLLVIFGTINYFNQKTDDLPFRCFAFSRYDLSRQEGKPFIFTLSQDLRFESKQSGYLLLNGQVTSGSDVTILNRRIALSDGNKIDGDSYRYKIRKIITSTNDTTPEPVFNRLLAEITLDPNHLQLDIIQTDEKSYLIGGPLSYLFTCQRY